MNDTLKRAARTFLQGFIGIIALLALPVLNTLISAAAGGGEIVVDLNAWRTILIAAIAGGVIALVSFVQNLLEDKTGTAVLPK